MRDLLFLAHRIPYPPNKGDKIRSWNILRHLSKSYRVHLGCFVDDPQDFQHEPLLREHCASCALVRLSPKQARLRSLRGLLTGAPLTLPYYRDRRMADFVNETMTRHEIDTAFIYSSAMAQYVLPRRSPPARVIADFVDVDSEKWRDYAQRKKSLEKWIYGREADALLGAERSIASQADASLFVSAAEADLFRRLAPAAAKHVDWVGNGVDCDFFSPQHRFDTPYDGAGPIIVFTGAMDYWPNVDAVHHFCEDIWPAVLQERPDVQFHIVGARPTAEVTALSRHTNVHVAGSVPDIRPYLAHCHIAVAPMRIARGIQNKVLEAMAMGRSTIVSPQALEGIDATPGRHVLIAADAPSFAASVLQCLNSSGKGSEIGAAARLFVLDGHSWPARLQKLDELLADDALIQPPAAR